MCFKLDDTIISIFSGKPLKLVDQFIYLGSNISSTESDVNMCIEKARSPIDRQSIILKSEFSDKITFDFFHDEDVSETLYGRTTGTPAEPI